MSRPGHRGWQLGGVVAAGRVDLGLGEEQGAGQIGTTKIGVAEIGSDQVRLPQIGVTQVGADQVGAPETGTTKVRTAESGPDQVGAAAVLLLFLGAPDELAGPEQEFVDDLPLFCHIDLGHVLQRELLDVVEAFLQVCVDLGRFLELQRFGQIPEQFVQLPHDRQGLEHLLPRRLTPRLAGKPGDLLAGAEAVIDRAALEAFCSQLLVDAAAEVFLQIRAGLAGLLVDREVGRLREGQRDAAESEAIAAIRAEVFSEH